MSVSQCYVIRRNLISLQPPPEADRNGVIIRYDIFYLEEEEEEETNTTLASPRVFSVAEYTPSDPEASGHSTRLGGLAGGKRYLVKMRAATSVGAGPNSTLVSIVTLEREKTNSLLSFSPFTSSLHLSFLSFMIIFLLLSPFFNLFFIVSFSPFFLPLPCMHTLSLPAFPLLLVLAIGVPAASLLLLLCLLVSLCLCYRCCYLRSRAGKHSPLTEEAADLFGQQRKRKGRV